MTFSAISVNPIVEGLPDAGWQAAKGEVHQDSTAAKPLIGVRNTVNGKAGHYEPGAGWEWDRDKPGIGEQFTEGPGSTVATVDSGGKTHVFLVA